MMGAAQPVLGRATVCSGWGFGGSGQSSSVEEERGGATRPANEPHGPRTLVNPFNGFAYTRAPFVLNGTVRGLRRSSGGTRKGGYDEVVSCEPIAQALVEVWQADAYGRYDSGIQQQNGNQNGNQNLPPLTALAQAHLAKGTFTSAAEAWLSGGECRAAVHADGAGAFRLDTECPARLGRRSTCTCDERAGVRAPRRPCTCATTPTWSTALNYRVGCQRAPRRRLRAQCVVPGRV